MKKIAVLSATLLIISVIVPNLISRNIVNQQAMNLSSHKNLILKQEGKIKVNEEIKIRQIGDPVLNTAPTKIDLKNTQLIKSEIKILMADEIKYGGVGISANQSSDILFPTQICIVGTDDPIGREQAQARYPHDIIPYATIMINPEILSFSDETYYPQYGEGCLSVSGPINGKVKRHKSVVVRYQDIEGKVIVKTAVNFEAHIIQHEYNHLQGKVFLQNIFDDCTVIQIQEIKKLVKAEIDARKNTNFSIQNLQKNTSGKILIFDRQGDAVKFDSNLLSSALIKTPNKTLFGINTILELY